MNTQEYYDQRYAEIPPWLRDKASRILQTILPTEIQSEIIAAHAFYGEEWIHHVGGGHFGFGMKVRNLLRENGIKDPMFISGNLDDYYIQLLEKAVGIRK